MSNYIFTAPGGDAPENLARDEYLLNTLKADDLALYFYVNRRAVILGKNQCHWAEVDLKNLEADGVQLVRRVTGGGAVYHDMGNLNYSFIAGKNRYNMEAQRELIRNALAQFGIQAQATGRNDLTIDGKKFSGTAYCSRNGVYQSHGTLMVTVDRDAMSRYLSPSKLKLQSNGVKSVRSRVCALTEFVPDLTVEKLRSAMIRLFEQSFGPAEEPEFHSAQLEELMKKHRSPQWVMDPGPRGSFHAETRLSDGTYQLWLTVDGSGLISGAKIYTDSMDSTLPQRAEPVLVGVPFNSRAMAAALADAGFDRLASWANELDIQQ